MHIVFQNALDGADSLFLILPDVVEDPTEDVFSTMQAAKEAGVNVDDPNMKLVKTTVPIGILPTGLS